MSAKHMPYNFRRPNGGVVCGTKVYSQIVSEWPLVTCKRCQQLFQDPMSSAEELKRMAERMRTYAQQSKEEAERHELIPSRIYWIGRRDALVGIAKSCERRAAKLRRAAKGGR